MYGGGGSGGIAVNSHVPVVHVRATRFMPAVSNEHWYEDPRCLLCWHKNEAVSAPSSTVHSSVTAGCKHGAHNILRRVRSLHGEFRHDLYQHSLSTHSRQVPYDCG